MHDHASHPRSRSWSLSVWTKLAAFVVAALCVAFAEGHGPSARSSGDADNAPRVPAAESSPIVATCHVWTNVYKPKWLFLRDWGHHVTAPCADRFGCHRNAEWKYHGNVNATGPTHSWIEGGKAQDSHGECG